ncbi:MAG: class I SAM-dependent methyltransferase [Magnetococcus sp. THC-1_WYH]
MNKIEYRKMFEVENRHWWFSGKRHLVLHLARRYLSPLAHIREGAAPHILDAGCGTGRILEELSTLGTPFGCDLHPDLLGFCLQRGLHRLVQCSVESFPFQSSHFHLVCLLDTLYSVADDRKALRQVHRILAPGGVLILTDSAFQFLYGPHDRAAHGVRRYQKKELEEKLLQAGFLVERLSYFNFFLFPVALVVRLFRRWVPDRAERGTDVGAVPGWLNRLLLMPLLAEVRWLSRFNLPFGLSLWVVARKPPD